MLRRKGVPLLHALPLTCSMIFCVAESLRPAVASFLKSFSKNLQIY
jgi:hypothetical protein